MGNTSHSSQQAQSQTSYDPDLKNAFLQNYGRATTLADNSKFTPYTGSYGGSVTNDSLTKAGNIAQGLTTFNAPDAVGSGYKASTYDPSTYNAGGVTAGQLATTSLDPYFNPYTKDVINSSVADLMHTKGIMDTDAQSKATAAGAFGGSRSAVLQSLGDSDWQRNLMGTVSGLRNTGYQTAQQAAFQDIANKLQADEFSVGQGNAARQFNAGAQNTAGAFNAGANNTASQFGAAAGNTASLANQSAALDAARVRQGAAGLFGQLGQGQQTQENLLANANVQEFLRQQNWPFLIQQMLNQSAGLLPNSTVGTSNSNGSSSSYQVGPSSVSIAG